jgi:hypothetical protein
LPRKSDRATLADPMAAHEIAEKIEHLAHEEHGGGHGGGHGGPGKGIGITMALLGVMLALCAALVGAHRTDLIKTTVEQSNKWGLYQAEAMKLRIIEGDVEMLHAISPNIEEEKQLDANLRNKSAHAGKADDEDTAEIKDLIATSIDDLAELLTPDKEDEVRLGKLAKRYENDMKEAKEDAEAFDPKIEAHTEAAEWYERAQLLAEIGIVVASVALLLSNRKIWTVAIVAGVAGAGIIGWTFVKTHGAINAADKHIEEAAKRTEAIEEDDDDDDKGGGAEKKEGAEPAKGAESAKPAESAEKK